MRNSLLDKKFEQGEYMKRFRVLILVVIFSILISGCTFQEGTSGVSLSDDSFELEYENIGVEETHDFIMNENDHFKVLIKNDKGNIKILIKDSSGKELYSGNNLSTSEFNVEIKNADTYTIEVDGRRVSGELHFYRIRNN
jgi:hypothetical protein